MAKLTHMTREEKVTAANIFLKLAILCWCIIALWSLLINMQLTKKMHEEQIRHTKVLEETVKNLDSLTNILDKRCNP